MHGKEKGRHSPTNMRVLITSRGLVMVVVTRPAIIELVKWVCVPSVHPVYLSTPRLTCGDGMRGMKRCQSHLRRSHTQHKHAQGAEHKPG